MSGNQDSETGAARAKARTLEVQARLDARMERTLELLEAHEPDVKALVEVQRYLRALELTGRLALMMERMVVAPPQPKIVKPATEDEADMSRVERDDSPQNLERLRAKLEAGFDRLHEQFEQKSRDPGDEPGDTAQLGGAAAEPDPRPSLAA